MSETMRLLPDDTEIGLSTKEDLQNGYSSLGERLPYNDYTSIDWMHDLVRTIDSVANGAKI